MKTDPGTRVKVRLGPRWLDGTIRHEGRPIAGGLRSWYVKLDVGMTVRVTVDQMRAA